MSDNDLISLLSLDIPDAPVNEDGFLEIASMAHLENVNSRVYAYFLNIKNQPKIAKVFLDSLLELIREKNSKELSIEDYFCVTEELTYKGNRIDIVINDESNRSAIIIENKLYHHLSNDLMDYWNHLDYMPDNKVGILLTLEPLFLPSYAVNKYINITHLEWITKIKGKGLPVGIPSKFYVFLNDFFTTIENMSRTDTITDQALFYFQHTKKVLKAAATIDEAYKFINNQLEIIASKLELQTYGTSKTWRNIWDAENEYDAFYTVIFGGLLNGDSTIQVIIELQGECMGAANKLREILSENQQYQLMDQNGTCTKTFMHFLKREYKLTEDDIKSFADTVFNIIERDFKPVMDRVMLHLYRKTTSE